jgi:hypothetical protein
MTNRSIAVLLIGLATALPAAGCSVSRAGDEAAAAIPSGPSPFRGTWHGSATEVGSGPSFYASVNDLRINDDGTWTMTETRGVTAVRHSGTSVARGNRLTLADANGRRWMTLRQSGGKLYGLEDVRGANGSVLLEFTRSEP